MTSPSAKYTQSFVPTTRGHGSGRGRGRGGRGRGGSSNQEFIKSSQHNNFQSSTMLTQSGVQSSYSHMSWIVFHNCEGKGHISRVFPSPKINSGN